jgi:hypothetical protein
LKHSIIVAFVVTLSLVVSVTVHAASKQDWQNFIDAVAAGGSAVVNQAAGEFLPPGVGDIASALKSSPDVVKTGLLVWLHNKQTQAAIDNNMVAEDRYQAFYTCLSGDCSKVQALTRRPDDFGGGANGPDVDTSGGRQSSIESGTNRQGSDYKSFDLSSADPGACESACLGDQTCKAWTYVRPGVQGDSARCWLKTAAPDPTADDCCTSGKIADAGGGTETTIPNPMVGDLPLDVCRIFENECGNPAADAYCQQNGYSRSSSNTTETVERTRVIGDGRVCEPPHPCGRIATVTCVR